MKSLGRLVATLSGILVIGLAIYCFLNWRGDVHRRARLIIHESRMSQLRVALLTYEEIHGSLLPASSDPPVSWRVKLLPQIEQTPLAHEYAEDQPWDSPVNRALIARCPTFYSHDPPGGLSEILMVTTANNSETPSAANALLLAIDASIFAVPWTRPNDITFEELDQTLRRLISERRLSRHDQVYIARPAETNFRHRLVSIDELLEIIKPELVDEER